MGYIELNIVGSIEKTGKRQKNEFNNKKKKILMMAQKLRKILQMDKRCTLYN